MPSMVTRHIAFAVDNPNFAFKRIIAEADVYVVYSIRCDRDCKISKL
jgi:hypothetical protein